MTFEWDSTKATANLRKHKVLFTEAASVFLDPLALTFADPDHSEHENREITIGISNKERTLFVSHYLRGDRLRIISARKATKREKIQYAEKLDR